MKHSEITAAVKARQANAPAYICNFPFGAFDAA